jgi:hypothetical protein
MKVGKIAFPPASFAVLSPKHTVEVNSYLKNATVRSPRWCLLERFSSTAAIRATHGEMPTGGTR